MWSIGELYLVRILSVAGLALAVIAIVATLREAPPAQPPETAAAIPERGQVSREEMLDALVDRIAEESAGLADAPTRSPPPDSASIAGEARDDISFAPPTPPAGYSFVPAPRQMAVSRPPRRTTARSAAPEADWRHHRAAPRSRRTRHGGNSNGQSSNPAY